MDAIIKGNIHSPSPIVSIHSGEDTHVHAFAQNGDFFASADLGRTWHLTGNVFGPPIPALQRSWGELKARYR